MEFLAEESAASFSPSGILRTPANGNNPIGSVRALLERVKG